MLKVGVHPFITCVWRLPSKIYWKQIVINFLVAEKVKKKKKVPNAETFILPE